MTLSIFRQREARRHVALSARLRVDRDWEDARICNISSRGMMIACRTTFPRGAVVEIRRGQAMAIGRVVWSRSEHFGVRLQDRIRIDDFIEAKASEPRHHDDGELRERRQTPRLEATDVHAQSRRRSSAIQLAAIASVAVAGGGMIAIAAWELLGSMSEAVGAALL